MDIPRLIREKQEQRLSRYACKSTDSKGRVRAADKCDVRTEFERDAGKILYSLEFRRLRHKTQVFFNPKNDHICTRMEHVLYVNYIANTIARSLDLNTDLVDAIALGHDIGHPPFGHTGEKVLDKCLLQTGEERGFQHEMHSLRVADRLVVRKDRPGVFGFNLTFEVRDGIVSHCGETYDELVLSPKRSKGFSDLEGDHPDRTMPATLEGCVVRFADKIAYVGRDIEDAVRAGIMEMEDIPCEISSELGSTNGQIINTLVMDIVENSMGKDEISISRDKGEALSALLMENVSRIYKSEKIKAYEKIAGLTVEGLFGSLVSAFRDPEKMSRSAFKVYRMFFDYVKEREYSSDVSDARKVSDFIAGMSDSFASKCYEEIYWI